LRGKPGRSKLAVFAMAAPMPVLSIVLFGAVFGAATLAGQLALWTGVPYVLLSIVCFAAYARDKAAARAGRRRTPERSLLLLGLLCGWPGAVLAQQWLRHKSSKRTFQVAFWISVACNLGVFACLYALLPCMRPG
jgi:uncharacterized membrane protein YsdA (DUF1294 family)